MPICVELVIDVGLVFRDGINNSIQSVEIFHILTIITYLSPRVEVGLHPISRHTGNLVGPRVKWVGVRLSSARIFVRVEISTSRGVHPPNLMIHFPLFRFPPFLTVLGKFPQLFRQNLLFHPPKFLMTIFSRRLWIWNSLLFSQKPLRFPHIFSSDIVEFTCFLHTSRVFPFPYFYQDVSCNARSLLDVPVYFLCMHLLF